MQFFLLIAAVFFGVATAVGTSSLLLGLLFRVVSKVR